MTDWNKAIYTDDAPPEHEQPGMLHPGVAAKLDTAKTVTGHAIAGFLSGVNPLNIPGALVDAGTNVYNAAKEGDIAGAIGAATMNPPSAQDRAATRAQLAYGAAKQAEDKGDSTAAFGYRAEGALHHLFSVLPIVGPTGEEAYNNLLEGVRQGDPGQIGDAIGGVGALLAPETLRASKYLPKETPVIGSEPLMRSAGNSYYKTVTPIDVPNKVPAAQRAARDLAEGPAPITMTRQGFIDKMSAGADASARAANANINFDATGKTGPVQSLSDVLDRYAEENYKSPHAAGGGQRVVINPTGMSAIQDLKDRLDKAATGGTPGTPAVPGITLAHPNGGIITIGGAPAIPGTPNTTVALEHTEKLRQGLERGTLNSKGDWRTDISPDSVQAMDRAHARVIRDWQEQNAPEMQAGRDPIRMFSQMRDRAQEVKNRQDAGGPKSIPIWSNVKSGKMPQAIQNSMANIPWNTVAGATKAAAAKAIQSGDWGKVTRILQFAKLGVPVSGDNDGQ